jgi:pimeloyl-ACP methyl ester carboxylesterase
MELSGRPISLAAGGWEFSGWAWGPETGRPVLLLHGFPQTATAWAGVAERLAGVGHRVIAVNQRGYSDGARPSAASDYALPALVGDAVEIIDALGGSVDLVGHDWGAVVGWQVAARHPERVRTWTAVSTAHPVALNEVLATDAEQRARFSYILTFRRPGVAESALLADGAARLRQLYGGHLRPERLAEEVAFFERPGVLTAALNWYRAMSPGDADGLDPVTVPTSYVWGSADVAFGRAAAERSGDFVEGPYAFVPIEGASHWLLDEAPDVLADVIVQRVDAE